MAIPTSRVKVPATILIDESLCTGCGFCVEVCKDFGLILKSGKVAVAQKPVFGCIGCGHCMAICPQGAIKINGRCITSEDLFALPGQQDSASYEAILNLLLRRRSIREFKEIPVEKSIIEKVLKAAKTAPMGLPPSDVNVLIFDSQDKVRQFAEDFCDYLEGIKWLVSGWFLRLCVRSGAKQMMKCLGILFARVSIFIQRA